MTSLCGVLSSSVPHDLHIANAFSKVKKAPIEIHPLPQKKKLFTSASTRTELHKTNIKVESPSE